ncbi:MAG: SUMF1/EgtB/PvdO family nonheme iron enzyme [Acidobacteriota bacterium]
MGDNSGRDGLEHELGELRAALVSLPEGVVRDTIEEKVRSLEARLTGTPEPSPATSLGDVHDSVIVIGDGNVAKLVGALSGTDVVTDEELDAASRALLRQLSALHVYADFRGMNVDERLPLRIPLLDLFVPLHARCEPRQVPGGEEACSEGALARVGGRELGEGEAPRDHRRPVVDVLAEHDGVVVLGDPGAGKSSLLKVLALRVARDEAAAFGGEGRLPMLASLAAYAREAEATALSDFLPEHLGSRDVHPQAAQLISRTLETGRALVLLDGLDEVADEGLRRTVVDRVAEFLTSHQGQGNRVVMTSRIVGYREVRAKLPTLTECTLVDFDGGDVEAFVDRWTLAVERVARVHSVAEVEAAREKKDLLDAFHRSEGVRNLAANPLLLTILCLLKRQRVTLPEERVELYQAQVEALIHHWNAARGAKALPVHQTLRLLAPLALWMHETSPQQGLVPTVRVRERLVELMKTMGVDDVDERADTFLNDLAQHAGLLIERGPKLLGFLHLTFQEYLAAVGLALRGQEGVGLILEYLRPRVTEPAWREVTRLCVAYLALVQHRDESAGAVIEALAEMAAEGADCGKPVVLAGEAAVDIAGALPPSSREVVTGRLLTTLRDDESVAPAVRAVAGDALAELGDPRFNDAAWGLMSMEHDPLLGFVEVPAGSFLMGAVDGDEGAPPDEKPQHELSLDGFFIGRFPVTVAQFRRFVEESGHVPEHPRSTEGPGSRPVVLVTWHEALAYCAWLTERLRQDPSTPELLATLLRDGDDEGRHWRVSLPSEAEWERAARARTDGASSTFRYPWSDDPDPGRANVHETGLRRPTAVGCFPGGATDLGLEEVAGNVYEWTRSLWGDDWQAPSFGYPYRPDDGREDAPASDATLRVVRGGSFRLEFRSARCSLRRWSHPDLRSDNFGFRVVFVPILP